MKKDITLMKTIIMNKMVKELLPRPVEWQICQRLTWRTSRGKGIRLKRHQQSHILLLGE